MKEPVDLPITHEDHLFNEARIYGGNLKADLASVAEQQATAKYYKATEAEFNALVSKLSASGNPISIYQQMVVRTFLVSVYQDGIISALRDQTDKLTN